MRLAETDKPQGSTYRRIFAAWLKQNKFDDMDKSDRFRVLEILANRPEIEKWRSELPPNVRMKLNHPRSVLRYFKASQQSTAEPT